MTQPRTFCRVRKVPWYKVPACRATRLRRAHKARKALLEWTELGFVEIRIGEFMRLCDITAKQAKALAAGSNRVLLWDRSGPARFA